MFQKSRITIEKYDAEYNRLEKQLKEISESMNAVNNDEKILSNIKELLSTDIKTMYSLLDSQRKQAFWQSIIKQITITDGLIDFSIKSDFVE